jgi:hypothetical protein
LRASRAFNGNASADAKIAFTLQFAAKKCFRILSRFASRDFVYKISDFSSTVRDFSLDTEGS